MPGDSELANYRGVQTSQLNLRLPEDIIKRAKIDAIEIGVPLATYASEAFASFLSKNTAQRRCHFDGKRRKIMGRKLAVS